MTVVALVPAKDSSDTVADTVAALLGLEAVDEVVVVDDGSTDDTADVALSAGARVLRLPRNVGKGGAVASGVAATPEAEVYLLVDADVGSTAAVTDRLLAPVLGGQADLAVAVLPVRSTSRVIVPRLQRDGLAVRYDEFDGPHTVPPEVARQAMDWFLS